VATIKAPYGRWEPARPGEVASIFAKTPCPWWVAGGYAIELAAGRPIREHGDIDVMVLRRDQFHVQRALDGWEWWAADPPGTLRPWARAEALPVGVHDVWCRPGPTGPWRIQVMLDESDGGDWVSRRDAGLRRPIASVGQVGRDGVPHLSPDIQLYYKAKQPRPKDEVDFTAVLPFLTETQRRWLGAALAHSFGEHPWRSRLEQQT
jgi:hypothetical protein